MHTSVPEALAWRYATNQFDTTKKVSADDLKNILAAGNLMPTSFGLQPFRFVVVENQAVKDSLVEHSYGQKYVAENSHLIVLATRTDIDAAMVEVYINRIAETRGMEVANLAGFKDMMIGAVTSRSEAELQTWAQKQASIALGGMIAEASMLEIDNHALEGFSVEKYDELLGLREQNLTAAVILAIGYRAEADDTQHWKKVRRDREEVVVTI